MLTVEPFKAVRLLYGNPVTLVTSHLAGRTNIMTMTWVTPISVNPALVAAAVTPSSLTHKYIAESGEFVLNIPDLGLLREVHICGTYSGRGLDKMRVLHMATAASQMVKPLVLLDCIAAIECQVLDRRQAGDRILFIAEIVCAAAEPDRFGDHWLDAAHTLHHIGGDRYVCQGQVHRPQKARL